jgi:antagonist of KipI
VSLRILRPGALATVQDLGRRGLQHLAIVPGGAMDGASHRLANALVGNRGDAATLEIGLSGPEIQFDRAALVALHGARFEATLDGAAFPGARPVLVRGGARLRIGRALEGCFGYLAIAGGIDVPRVLGSRCTYLPGSFGGLDGQPVAAGAVLPLAPDAEQRAAARFAPFLARRDAAEIGAGAGKSVRWFAPALTLPATDPPVVRAVDGVHAALFTDEARAAFFGERWRVAPDSNRMGYRLLGPKLDLVRPTEIVSQATCLGTVQVPASGQPIALMADHQTTGGYPKIAEVIAADIPLLAQLAPGAPVRFVRASLGDSDQAREAFGTRLAKLVERVLWEFSDEDD